MTLSDKRESKVGSNLDWYSEVSVKATIENIEIKMLKRFGMAGGPSVMKIIREEVGEELRK